MRRVTDIFLVLFFLSITFTPHAHAYLDPGTGSYLIQLLIGGAVGGGFLIKTYWAALKERWSKLWKKKQPTQTSSDNHDSK
ncbi:hypothetical protein HGA91_03980 [candidate division WWE3 bacterium]|nr:hypothetical protein [candidate division WWE3 bacterium]